MGSVRELARAARDIFGKQKEFSSPWVGHPLLNRLGMHGARIALSDAALQLRRLEVKGLGAPPELRVLEQEGVVVIPNALPAALFDSVREEARERVAAAALAHPEPTATTSRGFGPKLPFAGGFDRFDGNTLNRFWDITPEAMPGLHAAVRSQRMSALCRAASGFPHQPRRFWLYRTVAGDELQNPDPQRALHRDTFYSAIKLWLFFEDVSDADGPFQYVPGSHRMSRARYRWEHGQARAAVVSRGSGSFRVDVAELAGLGLPQPRAYPVPANTLIIADVRGFHRRGPGQAGADRLALYANLRTRPFSPLAY
jgi:Phytanoyl-CoA dioxygenase (PhyH)